MRIRFVLSLLCSYLHIEHSIAFDLAAASWYGLDSGYAAYVCLGTKEYVGADYQLYVTSGITAHHSNCG